MCARFQSSQKLDRCKEKFYMRWLYCKQKETAATPHSPGLNQSRITLNDRNFSPKKKYIKPYEQLQ